MKIVNLSKSLLFISQSKCYSKWWHSVKSCPCFILATAWNARKQALFWRGNSKEEINGTQRISSTGEDLKASEIGICFFLLCSLELNHNLGGILLHCNKKMHNFSHNTRQTRLKKWFVPSESQVFSKRFINVKIMKEKINGWKISFCQSTNAVVDFSVGVVVVLRCWYMNLGDRSAHMPSYHRE